MLRAPTAAPRRVDPVEEEIPSPHRRPILYALSRLTSTYVGTRARDIFVADGYGNARIVHFNMSGKLVKTWGKLGAEPGEIGLPHAIALDSKGRLYVADRNNARVQVFDQAGKFLDRWRDLVVPCAFWMTAHDEFY
jgi:hypothetical protein